MTSDVAVISLHTYFCCQFVGKQADHGRGLQLVTYATSRNRTEVPSTLGIPWTLVLLVSSFNDWEDK